MSGHRWCTVSLCSVVTLLQAGCQSDGISRMAWNPFVRRAEKAEVTDRPSFSLPKFARRKSADEEQPPEKSLPLIAEGRVETLLDDGQLALQENRLDDARRAYTEILSSAPENATAHHGLAMTADLSQLWADAEYHYKQALRIRPRDANLLCDLGYSYVLQNRFSEASSYLNQAIEINPQHESAQMNLALLDLKQGNRAAAEERIVQRFGSSAAASQAMTQLESRLAGTGNAVAQASASTVLAPNATLEQVQALAAREREAAELRRANLGTRLSGWNQLPPAIIPQAAQEPAIAAQPVGGGYPGQPVNPPLNQPIAAGNPPGNSVIPAAVINPAASYNSATNYSTLTPTTPGNWNPPATGNLANSQPLSSAPPNVAAMTARIVPVHSSGAFQAAPGAGVSFGQPLGFGSPPGQIPVNTISATNGSTHGMQGFPSDPSTPQVQLEGLNVGPGALFPIGQSVQSGGFGGVSANGTGFNGAFADGSAMTPVQQGTRGGVSAGDGSLQMGNVSAPGTNSLINGTMYTQPAATLPAQEWAIRQQQLQQQQTQSRFVPGNTATPGSPGAVPGAWPPVQPPLTNPLSGYERQLQQIDNQYNNALQQMDGRSQPDVPTAQY